MFRIIHNAQCSKSNYALNLLKERNVEFEVRDYLGQPLTADELRILIQKLGIPAIELIRRSEPLFKEKFEGMEFSDEKWIEFMAEYPVLIQRPILISGSHAVIGRPEERIISFLKEEKHMQ